MPPQAGEREAQTRAWQEFLDTQGNSRRALRLARSIVSSRISEVSPAVLTAVPGRRELAEWLTQTVLRRQWESAGRKAVRINDQILARALDARLATLLDDAAVFQQAAGDLMIG